VAYSRSKQYIIEKSESTMPSKRRLSDASTLVQLLVVIVIIGLLASLAVPVLGKARESSGDRAKSMSNMRQISSVYQKDVEIYKKLSYSKALSAIGNSKGSDQSAE
jgi:type II secretory pathway pseudopilin PulG